MGGRVKALHESGEMGWVGEPMARRYIIINSQ